MNDYESIYTNHYQGETYRFGLAYLRSEADPSEREHGEALPSIEEQREIIARLALSAQTLVIAEFIDTCGPIPARERPGWNELTDFYLDTHPQLVFAASEEVLGSSTHDNFHTRHELSRGREEVIVTHR